MLAEESSIKIEKDQTIDPGFLYQIFLVMLKIRDLSLDHVLSYELITFPAVLFEGKEIFSKRNKSVSSDWRVYYQGIQKSYHEFNSTTWTLCFRLWFSSPSLAMEKRTTVSAIASSYA